MKASAIARYPASVGCGSPFEQKKVSLQSRALWGTEVSGRIEGREDVRDTGARRRRGSCDWPRRASGRAARPTFAAEPFARTKAAAASTSLQDGRHAAFQQS